MSEPLQFLPRSADPCRVREVGPEYLPHPSGAAPMSVLTVPTANAEDELPPLTIRDVLPNPRAMARQALPRVAEATLIPLVLFYVAFWSFGVAGALAGALVWSYGLLLHRLLTGRRVPGMVMLAALALPLRTLIAPVSGSASRRPMRATASPRPAPFTAPASVGAVPGPALVPALVPAFA